MQKRNGLKSSTNETQSMIQKRVLGRTGLLVTCLGFGAMELRGPRIWNGRAVTDAQAESILNAVLDEGINFIDTSPDYGYSEELIGRFISTRREEYFLATKCGCTVVDAGDHDETPHVWTRENLLRNIEESLRRMRTDYVDILQLHNPAVEVAEENCLVDALLEIKRAGHTKFIGVSTALPQLPVYLEWGVFDAFQVPYSALERTHEDWIAKISESGAGLIIRGGVAKGAVASEERFGYQASLWNAAGLDEILGGMSRMEFMLRFTLSHSHIDTVIVGTLSPDHLRENVIAAKNGALPADLYEEAKRRLSAAGEDPPILSNRPGRVW